MERVVVTTETQLKALIREVLAEFQQPNKPVSNNGPELMTRKETASLLKVSLPTLTAWEKAGKIKSKRLGSRVYYFRSSIEKS